MPIYAYRCASCGHAKDVLQKLSDPLLSTCPGCGAETFRKQLTAAGFQLKGSGWYVTDFKGGAAPATAKPDDAKPTDKPADKPADGDKPATPPAAASPAAAPAAGTTAPAAASTPAAAAATTKPSSQGSA